MRRFITILIILLVLAAAGYFGLRRYEQVQAASATTYQTVNVTRGELTATVGATGTVRSKQSVSVSWQTTGRVKTVNVKEGDAVKKGQTLAVLDEASLPQSVILARSDLVTAQRNLDQLKNSDVARANAQQALAQAQKAYDDAKTQRESKQYARASDATVEQARANYILAQDNTSKAQDNYNHLSHLPEDDPNRAAAYAALAAAQQKEDTALANLNWLLGRPDTSEIAQADASLAVAEANLKDAQKEYDRLKNGPDPNDITAAEARIEALQATISMVDLEAPVDGTVTNVGNMPGDQASPAQPAFQIDDLSSLLVDVQITEVDINRVKIGQTANLAFDAIPENQYTGKVTQVSNIGQAVQGVVNFTVTVQLDGVDGEVKPGMTAAVNIVTDQIPNAIIVPNRAVRLNNGQHVVWVMRGGQPVMTAIELGKVADSNSEVIGGDIKEGDELVLNPPAKSLGQGGGLRNLFGGGGK